MQQCHTYCCLLHTHCLVSSHNTIYSSLKRERFAWQHQITVAKGTMLTTVPLPEEKIKIIRLQLVASKYNSMWLYNENWNSVVSTIYPNHRNILILNEWGYTEHEKRLIFQRGLLDLLLPYWTLPSVHEIRDKMQFIYKELPCAWVKSKVA